MASYNRRALQNIKKASFTNSQDKSVPDESSSPESSQNLNFRGARYQNLGSHENDPNYGCPIAGSKTEYRGKQAGIHVSSEIVELCDIIQQIGRTLPDGTFVVTFGVLFEFYTRISNKLVGILMRARKQGLVEFQGEMLFQRRDDHVIIRLVKLPDQLMKEISEGKEELKHHATKN